MYVNARGQLCLEKHEFVERMARRLREQRVREAAKAVRAERAERARRAHASVRMSREQRRADGASTRGCAVEWTPEAVALLGTMSDKAVAERVGCGATAVLRERRRRGIAPFAQRRTVSSAALAASGVARRRKWTDEEAALLGTMGDARVAKIVGCSETAARKERERRGIPRVGRGCAGADGVRG